MERQTYHQTELIWRGKGNLYGREGKKGGVGEKEKKRMRQRDSDLPHQRDGRKKREGVGETCLLKGPLHPCRVTVLLAMPRGVTHCARLPRGRAKVCLNAHIPLFFFIKKMRS